MPMVLQKTTVTLFIDEVHLVVVAHKLCTAESFTTCRSLENLQTAKNLCLVQSMFGL